MGMKEIEARLKLTRAIMEAIRQGLTLDDIKKVLKIKVDLENSKKNIRLNWPPNRP